MQPPHLLKIIRFGIFELDLQAGELRKQGQKIRLQEQPLRLLTAVLERPGEVVSREELARRLWDNGTLVDVDNGLNIAMRKLRQALSDDADTPRYVETVPRRGYRFIGVLDPYTSAAAPVTGELPQSTEYPVVVVPKRRYLPWRWFTLMAAGLAAVTLMVRWLATSLRPPRVLRVTQLTRTGHAEVGSGIATDGSRIYFIERSGGVWRVSQVSASGGTPVPLAQQFSSPDVLAISPQRSELLVVDYRTTELEGDLWILPTIAGQAQKIPGITGHAATWSRDGRSLIFANGSALFRVERTGAGLSKLLDIPGYPVSLHRSPAAVPDLLSIGLFGKEGAKGLWICSPDGRNLRPVLPGWASSAESPSNVDYADWSADGKYLLFRNLRDTAASAWARRMRPGPLHRWDSPIQIYATPLQFAALAASPDAPRLFFAAGQEHRETLRYDARQKQFVPFLSGTPMRWINFSRDGQWLAYVSIPEGNLWRARADGSQARQLTFEPMHALEPHWSPDGRRLLFHGGPYGNESKLYLVPADGGPLETLTNGPYSELSAGWSPDGQSIIFRRTALSGDAAQTGIYILDLQSRQATRLPASEKWSRPTWSPDGRYATAMDRTQIVCFEFRTRRWRQLARGRGLTPPFWSRDSQYLYYQDVIGTVDQPMYRIRVKTGELQPVASSRQIPQAGLLGFTLTGMTPDDAPLATALRSNFDIYAMELDLP